MRVYRTAITKPIPPDTRFSKRKDGQYVTAVINGKRITGKVTSNGTMRIESNYYSLKFKDNRDILRYIRAYTNKRASEELAHIIEQLMQPGADISLAENMPARISNKLVEFGIIDGKRTAAGRSLNELISEYESWLRSSRVKRHGLKRCDEYCDDTITIIRKVADACRFRQFSDINKTDFEKYLGSKKWKSKTYNTHVVTFKGFCIWVVDNELAARNPLASCKGISADDKEKRRPISPDEFGRLMKATSEAPKRFELTPEQRVLMYLLATETGLRKNELVNLTVSSFDLDAGVVRLPREITKNRQAVKLPLKKERIQQLRDCLANKLPMVKVFPVTQSLRASEMLQKDLKDAQILFKTSEGICCFHSLRHTFSTNLSKTDATWVEHKVLMRHSLKNDITANYTKVSFDRQREIIEQLPVFELPVQKTKKAAG